MSRFWKQGMAFVALAAAVGLWCLPPSLAKPPGGGGGGGGPGQNGGGVIYIWYESNVYTMNDDGSGIALVAGSAGFSPQYDPSRQLHAGKRWFLQMDEVPGEFYPDFKPDGTTPKDFANRRVFVALSDAGDAVELTIPPDLEPLGRKWTVGDGYVSWPGRRWGIVEGTDSYGDVLEGGLYRTKINFDADNIVTGNVTGAGSSELVFPLSLVPSNAMRQSNDFTLGPDMLRFDWAPDGVRFVFDAVSHDELCEKETDTYWASVLLFSVTDLRMELRETRRRRGSL